MLKTNVKQFIVCKWLVGFYVTRNLGMLLQGHVADVGPFMLITCVSYPTFVTTKHRSACVTRQEAIGCSCCTGQKGGREMPFLRC